MCRYNAPNDRIVIVKDLESQSHVPITQNCTQEVRKRRGQHLKNGIIVLYKGDGSSLFINLIK